MQVWAWQVIEAAAGLACLTGWIVWLGRNGRWRNPLAGVRPADPPPAIAMVVVVFAYFAVRLVAASMLLPAQSGGTPGLGSDAWHRTGATDDVARIVASALMLVLFWGAQTRSTPAIGGRPRALAHTAAAVVALLVLFPIADAQLQLCAGVWGHLHPETEAPEHPVLVAFRKSAWGGWGQMQLLVGAVVIAPVTEELFFRGLLLGTLVRHIRRLWPAVVISGAAFGLIHIAQPQSVLPLVTMVVVLGYLRLRCGSLWPCIVLHALFNARTMIAALLAPELLRQA